MNFVKFKCESFFEVLKEKAPRKDRKNI